MRGEAGRKPVRRQKFVCRKMRGQMCREAGGQSLRGEEPV